MDDDALDALSEKIYKERGLFYSISQSIWSNPEISFKEHRAHDLLVSVLEKDGFTVFRKYLLPTAFRAEYSNGKGGPAVAILCEYDAMPDVGHSGGHNLTAEVGVAIGMALKAALERDRNTKAKVVVLGTPAEETGGGKIKMIAAGAFKDIDLAMMVRPSTNNSSLAKTFAVVMVTVRYKGKEAHAAASPWSGLNALDAAISAYNNISLLRQHIKPTCRIHGIITKGGSLPNVIPSETELKFYIRAPNIRELELLRRRVEACFTAAAQATGCTVKTEFDDNIYEDMMPSKMMAEVYRKRAEYMGIYFDEEASHWTESTDMGNVSHVVPCIYPSFTIKSDISDHTKEFVKAAGSLDAQEFTLEAAKVSAQTLFDIIRSPVLMLDIKDEFKKDLVELCR